VSFGVPGVLGLVVASAGWFWRARVSHCPHEPLQHRASRGGEVVEPSPTLPPPLPAKADGAATTSPRRHVLPKDLPGAIKQLDDQELDRLLAAVLAEQKRRGRKPAESVEPPNNRRIEAAALHLTPGKMNAVRAAFKAGIKPSQIARQFGLSQSEVRKALASDASRRAPGG
jgi:hypothetical protein